MKVGGTTDILSGPPVELKDAVVEFIDGSNIVLLFGDNNRIVVTPRLRQITSPGLLNRLLITLYTDEIRISEDYIE